MILAKLCTTFLTSMPRVEKTFYFSGHGFGLNLEREIYCLSKASGFDGQRGGGRRVSRRQCSRFGEKNKTNQKGV